MNRRSPNDPLKETEPQHRNEPSPDFAGTEDTVDAMGAVAFADEEDCGFFGEPYCFPTKNDSTKLMSLQALHRTSPFCDIYPTR